MTLSQPPGFSPFHAQVMVRASWSYTPGGGLMTPSRLFARGWLNSGFLAFAPDLYHGQVAQTIEEAEVLSSALDGNFLQAKAEIAEATRFLAEKAGKEGNNLAVIGFSLGAYYALDLSNADPEHIRSVIVFYGSGVENFSQFKSGLSWAFCRG